MGDRREGGPSSAGRLGDACAGVWVPSGPKLGLRPPPAVCRRGSLRAADTTASMEEAASLAAGVSFLLYCQAEYTGLPIRYAGFAPGLGLNF